MLKGKSSASVIGLGAGLAAVVLVAYLALSGRFDPAPSTGAGDTATAGGGATTDPAGPPLPLDFNRFGAPAPSAALRYDSEYPTVDYMGTPLSGRIATLDRQLRDGSLVLDGATEKTFLVDLLAALDIDPSSQLLVFSKTSQQAANIAPSSPRAIYFNDDTYVAYVRNGQSFEIASMDPVLGPVYHTLQRPAGDLVREDNRCLRCHDSLSLTGGGVPRLLLGSGYIGTDGELVSHEAWILMRPWTPLKSRWGGWYVSGTHGDQVHLGNVIVEDIADLQDLESLRVGNRRNLGSLIDTSPYLTPYSDIVALLVIQHQAQVQNDITRLNWDLLTAAGVGWPELESALDAMPAEERDAIIFEQGEPLIETLVMAFDTALTAPVEGSSGYTEWFQSRGPADADGRSLRELDLQTRLFRYPLSYLLYSAAFDGLPVQARRYIYRRVREELEGRGRLDLDAVYPAEVRAAALDILAATKPEFAAAAD